MAQGTASGLKMASVALGTYSGLKMVCGLGNRSDLKIASMAQKHPLI